MSLATLASRRIVYSLAGVLFLAVFLSGLFIASGLFWLLSAIVLLVFTWKLPLFSSVFLFTVCQEINQIFSGNSLISLGNTFYFGQVAQLSFSVLFLSLASLSAARFGRLPKLDIAEKTLVLATLSYLVLVILSGLISGYGLLNTLNQYGVPWLFLLGGFFIAKKTIAKHGPSQLFFGVSVGLFSLALLGLASAFVSGNNFVFYDSATSFIAAVAILAVVSQKKQNSLSILLTVASTTLITLSTRRAVTIGLILAGIAFVISKSSSLRLKVGVISAASFFTFFLWIVPTTFSARFISAIGAFQGVVVDDPIRTREIEYANSFAYLLSAPGGYGIASTQLTGLFAVSPSIYVHNQLLQSALTLGLLGLFAIVAVFASLFWISFRAPASHSFSGMRYSGFVVTFSCMTAPFVSETTRWPFLIGVLMAYLSSWASSPRIAVLSSNSLHQRSHGALPSHGLRVLKG